VVLNLFIRISSSLINLLENFSFFIFHTDTSLSKKMLSKDLHGSPSVPHVEKAKRLSSKEKVKLRRENQTAEEHQIAKTHDNNEHNNSRQHEKDVSNVNNAGKHL
jgi:hypothetical protein